MAVKHTQIVGANLKAEQIAEAARRMREREEREYAIENLESLRRAHVRAGIERL